MYKMLDCPLCNKPFTTKQRLNSHLTRNKNKCYDTTQAGVPEKLLLVMGCKNDSKSVGSFVCAQCDKHYVNQKNLEKHEKTHQPAPAPAPSPAPVPVPASALAPAPVSASSLPQPTQVPAVPMDHELPNIYRSKRENRNMIIRKKPHSEQVVHKANVHYITKENYVDTLTRQLGSFDDAMKFIHGCIQSKMNGCLNLLYKIYFEGHDPVDYPIVIIDYKTKKLQYKTETQGLVLDEGLVYLKSVLVNNVRNCYLQFSNHVITANLEHNDVLFDEYCIGSIQNHILELSEDKNKDRIILGLIEYTRK
jgi:hypothetical protein